MKDLRNIDMSIALNPEPRQPDILFCSEYPDGIACRDNGSDDYAECVITLGRGGEAFLARITVKRIAIITWKDEYSEKVNLDND